MIFLALRAPSYKTAGALSSDKTPVVPGQLYTSQNVVASIARVNTVPTHPVRCRDGLMEMAVQLRSIDSSDIGHVAEIGVYQGDFSRQQASTWFPNAKLGAVYHAIDAWQYRPDDTGIAATRDKNYKTMQSTKRICGSPERISSVYQRCARIPSNSSGMFPSRQQINSQMR